MNLGLLLIVQESSPAKKKENSLSITVYSHRKDYSIRIKKQSQQDRLRDTSISFEWTFQLFTGRSHRQGSKCKS